MRRISRQFRVAIVLLWLPLVAWNEESEQPLGSDDSAQNNAEQRRALRRDIDQYLDRLDLLEQQYGAYEKPLAQELNNLGLLYQQLGQHREAVDVFKRQFQIERSNEGLYSLQQAPVLENMITSLKALREWEEVDDRYFLLQQLYNYNLSADDPKRVSALSEMADWHLEAFANGNDGRALLHLLTARNALTRVGDAVFAGKGVTDTDINSLTNKLLYSNYQLAIREQESAEQAQQRAMFERRIRNEYDSINQRNAMRHAQNQSFRSMQNSFLHGLRYLEGLQAAYRNDPASPPGLADSVDAQIGDWHALWQKHNMAKQYYQRAWQALAANPGAQDTLIEVFGEPVRLLNFIDQLQDEKPKNPGEVSGYVLFNATVTSSGKIRELTLTESDPAGWQEKINSAYQQVRRTRYRPRYEAGAPVETTGVPIRYRFDYTPSDGNAS